MHVGKSTHPHPPTYPHTHTHTHTHTRTLPTHQNICSIVGMNDVHNGALRDTPQLFQANTGMIPYILRYYPSILGLRYVKKKTPSTPFPLYHWPMPIITTKHEHEYCCLLISWWDSPLLLKNKVTAILEHVFLLCKRFRLICKPSTSTD
jgi:hypothetical protein